MKNISRFGLLVVASAMLIACGGNQKSGTKFAPKDRESALSDEERAEAIAEKKASLQQEVNVDSILVSHGVKFSVLPPTVSNSFPEAASDRLGTRMIQITSQNGLGGLCTNPVLAMVSKVDCVDSSVTGTAPQKAIAKYEVTFYCGNMVTGDVYASASQTVTGVGASTDEAAVKAMTEVKNTQELQDMLQKASKRAVEWYSTTANVSSYVDKACGEQNYALALAMLSSVPEQAAATFSYATKKSADVSNLLFETKAAELLGDFEAAIAAAGDAEVPELGAYLKVIPPNSSSYARAKKIYDEYLARIRKVSDDERNKAHLQEMEKLAVEKIKAPYEAQAAIEEIRENASLQKHEAWSGALTSAAESIGNGMRGGMFGENGLFGKGGLFGIGSFASCFGGEE